jgi:hypothetical protein
MGALDAAEIRPLEPRGGVPEADPATVRKFLLKLALFVAVWGALFFRGEWARYGVWVLGWAAVIAFGLFFPAPFRPVRRLALRLGALVGRALAFLALGFIYYVVVTPVALVARATGKRFLSLGKDADATTYWETRDPAPVGKESLERQF